MNTHNPYKHLQNTEHLTDLEISEVIIGISLLNVDKNATYHW
jgi:hypothetical protein